LLTFFCCRKKVSRSGIFLLTFFAEEKSNNIHTSTLNIMNLNNFQLIHGLVIHHIHFNFVINRTINNNFN
jgi:hypothetical protein